MAGPVLLTLLFPPYFLHPTEFYVALYILFHWSDILICSQMVFCMYFCVWRCVPDVSMQRRYISDVLHVHLLLHHLFLSYSYFLLWLLIVLRINGTGLFLNEYVPNIFVNSFTKKLAIRWNSFKVNLRSWVCVAIESFPGSASGKESACQFKRHKSRIFNLWIRKVPWRRKWQPTPVFVPGESHGHRRTWWVTVHGVTNSWTWLNTHAWHSNWKNLIVKF